MDTAIAKIPANPTQAKKRASPRRANSVNIRNPTPKPAKAKAVQGKMGNSQGCGWLNVCTPFRYDSSGQGRNCGRQVVQTAGVRQAITAAVANAAMVLRNRATSTVAAAVNQQSTPI